MNTTNDYIPLISLKHINEFTKEEYREYIRSLYQEPKGKVERKEYSASRNKNGVITIRINRALRILSMNEVAILAIDLGLTIDKMCEEVKRRKIKIG